MGAFRSSVAASVLPETPRISPHEVLEVSQNATRCHALTRREFTVESILSLLAGVTITVTGCGGYTSSPTAPTTTPPGTTSTQDVSGAISANHGHVATVTSAQITGANAVSLNIQGTATHNHVVSLTADQIRAIAARTQVAVQSSNDADHVHMVTFN
jgi:hypothetical protein